MYLSYVGEFYYPNFWFMTIERYFSEETVARIKKDNKRGRDLFCQSTFFVPYEPLNQFAEEESEEVKKYLLIDSLNQGYDFQPYFYMELKPNEATNILNSFTLNKRTLDIPTDRQVAAMEKRLMDLASGKIQLIVRYNKFLVGLKQ